MCRCAATPYEFPPNISSAAQHFERSNTIETVFTSFLMQVSHKQFRETSWAPTLNSCLVAQCFLQQYNQNLWQNSIPFLLAKFRHNFNWAKSNVQVLFQWQSSEPRWWIDTLHSKLHTVHRYNEMLCSLEVLDEASHKRCSLFLASSMAGFPGSLLKNEGGETSLGTRLVWATIIVWA